MSPLLLALSLAAHAEAPACAGAPADWLATLDQGADRDAYLCLAYADEAHAPLLAAARADGLDPDVANRRTRALAVHLMQRLERALTADEVRALNAADRRLLRDAVYARRGRATPSQAHAQVFQQFDWYQPDPRYTNARLTALDRDNIALLDSPPPAPEEPAAPTAADAVAEAQQAGPVVPKGMCGCATGGGGGLAAALVALWGLRRRRG